MEQILIVDSDSNHGHAIAAALDGITRHFTICAQTEEALTLISRKAFAAIVVAQTSRDLFAGLDAIRHAALRSPDPARIIYLLRDPYRGPAERVYAARKGFKVIYER